MLLFAYASNMDVHRFADAVPSAKKLSNAKLPGYQFSFGLSADDGSSKASLTPSEEPGAAAWGVLIEFNDDELNNFFSPNDWFEWTTVNCIDEAGNIYKAQAFVTLPHAINNFTLPYDWYQARLVKIAEQQKLPGEYIAQLAQMPCKTDPDEKRRARNMGKL